MVEPKKLEPAWGRDGRFEDGSCGEFRGRPCRPSGFAAPIFLGAGNIFKLTWIIAKVEESFLGSPIWESTLIPGE